jgi:hypothetical protein
MTRAQARIALIAVGLLALAGGSTALASKSNGHTKGTIAAPRGGHRPSDELDAAASYLGTTVAGLRTQLEAGKTLAQVATATSGKTTAGLIAALVTAEKTEIAAEVTAGRLTQAEADQITPALTQRFTDFVNGTRPVGGPPRGGFGHGPGPGLDGAASYLGISESSLFTQLRSGKTLAQIADATAGKSSAGLIDALLAAATKQLGSQAPSDLRRRITDLVNGVHPAGGPSHGFFRHGFFRHGSFQPGGVRA